MYISRSHTLALLHSRLLCKLLSGARSLHLRVSGSLLLQFLQVDHLVLVLRGAVQDAESRRTAKLDAVPHADPAVHARTHLVGRGGMGFGISGVVL